MRGGKSRATKFGGFILTRARRTHVNIVDLIEGDEAGTFGDVAELRAYTQETRKIFRNRFDQECGMLSCETPAS
ncbi:double-stranded RNA-binding type zinc finger domain protein [Rutstroemia sp. NJR-2017a WRK4]|nr:double-stranded RNA-binding type zinc finger domain protein [Rutstroemia sp. NJR-2017a WRK4]